MKKVILLGDSIRVAYQEQVRHGLGNDYTVYYPSENCRFSAYTLNSLRFWANELPYADADVIHWNNGLWDTAHLNGEDRCFCGIDEYVGNMERIYGVLRKISHAKIILATSTPTRIEKERDPVSKHFVTEIKVYNDALLCALGAKVDDVDDLYGLIFPQREKLISDDYIHPDPVGVDVLACEVCRRIKGV